MSEKDPFLYEGEPDDIPKTKNGVQDDGLDQPVEDE